MAVKVYTPDQFYATGGIVEEMFYEEVGKGTLRTQKQYVRKRVGFVPSFDQVIKNLNDEFFVARIFQTKRLKSGWSPEESN